MCSCTDDVSARVITSAPYTSAPPWPTSAPYRPVPATTSKPTTNVAPNFPTSSPYIPPHVITSAPDGAVSPAGVTRRPSTTSANPHWPTSTVWIPQPAVTGPPLIITSPKPAQTPSKSPTSPPRHTPPRWGVTSARPVLGGGPVVHCQVMFANDYRETLNASRISKHIYGRELAPSIARLCYVDEARISDVSVFENPDTGARPVDYIAHLLSK